MDKEKLYRRIDDEDDLTDTEKRRAYLDAIEEDADREMFGDEADYFNGGLGNK